MKAGKIASLSMAAAMAAAFSARADWVPCGYVTRSMREDAELRYEQAREWAEWQAREAELDASRRELAEMEMNAFGEWLAGGGRGFCPVQFDTRLPNPFLNTPEMRAFFQEHPEAVRPCDPTQAMVVPTPESAAAFLRMAEDCRIRACGGATTYSPAPFVPARFPMFIP